MARWDAVREAIAPAKGGPMEVGKRRGRAPVTVRVGLLVVVAAAIGMLPACQPFVGRTVPVITATVDPSTSLESAPVTVTVVVAPSAANRPTPTGTLTFPNMGTTVPLVNGRFIWTGAMATSGPFTVPFTYNGDGNYFSASGSVQGTVAVGMIPFSGSGPSVGMMGDSITFAAKPKIDERLAAQGDRSSVTGVLGWTTVTGQPLVGSYASTSPDVFVFDLGTNDLSDLALGQSGDPVAALAALEARVTNAAAMFPSACFVVTTVSAHRSGAWAPPYAAYNDAALAFDAWLRATFAHVVDWEAAVKASLDAGAPILSDEVHPNLQGATVLADLVGQAADGCLGRV